ncbi:MAG: T9SS type A sorting domain-containing protein [Ferruginibacter sp.]
MKLHNYTLQGVVFSFRLPAPIDFAYILAAIIFILSSAAYAGDVSGHLPADNNNSRLLKTPYTFTGTESIRTNLYFLNADKTTKLADGVLTEYNDLYHDIVTWEDAYKFTNFTENLGITRYGAVLCVERRPVISISDTLFFKLWKTTKRDYQFEFITINLFHPGRQAFLEDAYLGTSTNIVLSGTTKLNFSINADAASADVNRFRIIYQTTLAQAPLPVTFTSVKGYELNNKISIDWKVEREINVQSYEIEKSVNGTDFSKVNSTAVTGLNSALNSYSWIDDNPINGNNFYRIKSVDRDGSNKYSLIIKVTTLKYGARSISIYPNPITGNTINLQFTNQPMGLYYVRLLNNSGQVVYSKNLTINSGNISQTLVMNKHLSGGLYQLEVKAPDNTIYIQKAIAK